jgi:hypothetical protein
MMSSNFENRSVPSPLRSIGWSDCEMPRLIRRPAAW